MEIQPLKIGTKMAKVPVIQGGMGVGIRKEYSIPSAFEKYTGYAGIER